MLRNKLCYGVPRLLGGAPTTAVRRSKRRTTLRLAVSIFHNPGWNSWRAKTMPDSHATEVTLLDYWNVLVKRRFVILGLWLVSVVAASIVSLLVPPTFRGEVILAMPSQTSFLEALASRNVAFNADDESDMSSREFISVMGTLSGDKLRRILVTTGRSVTEIRLSALEDSVTKLRMIVDSRVQQDIAGAVAEFVSYANTKTYVAQNTDQARRLLSERSKEISRSVESFERIRKAYEDAAVNNRLTLIGLTPAEYVKGISDLKITQVQAEQALANTVGIRAVGEIFISRSPVLQTAVVNVLLATVLSVFAGLVWAFVREFIEKTRRSRDQPPATAVV